MLGIPLARHQIWAFHFNGYREINKDSLIAPVPVYIDKVVVFARDNQVFIPDCFNSGDCFTFNLVLFAYLISRSVTKPSSSRGFGRPDFWRVDLYSVASFTKRTPKKEDISASWSSSSQKWEIMPSIQTCLWWMDRRRIICLQNVLAPKFWCVSATKPPPRKENYIFYPTCHPWIICALNMHKKTKMTASSKSVQGLREA